MTAAAETATRAPAILLVAGEASGDLHGATLAAALRAEAPAARLYGMGGSRMAKAGVEIIADVTGDAVVGHTEALGRLPALWRAYRRLRAALTAEPRPSALVLIDFPDFNLRLAGAARRAGVPVVYFMPPQVWAWRRRRLATLRRRIALVIAAFPFEVPLHRASGIPVTYVGHPLLDVISDAPSRVAARASLGLTGAAPVLGLLPGSRRQEIAALLPAMADAARRIATLRPHARVLVGLAPTVDRAVVERHLGSVPGARVVGDGAHTVIRAADVLLVASGTVTLEAALLGTPMVVCYRMSRVSAIVTRLLIRIPWFSLVNIVLGRAVVPELAQDDVSGARLAAEALRLLDDADAAAAQRQGFAEIAEQLGRPGVGRRAAPLVLAVADGRR
jgi:lipid-A-disaccharide synthase